MTLRIVPRGVSLLLLVALVPVLLGGCASRTRTVPPTPGGEMEEARRLFNDGDYFETIQVLTRFLGESPGSRYVDEALLLLGKANYEDGDYFEAESRFRRVINEFPESPFACEASYHLGLALLSQSRSPELDQSETRAALAQFATFRARCPDHEFADRAAGHMESIQVKLAEKEFKNGKFYFRRGFYRAAIFYFEERVVEEFPDTPWATEAMYYLVRTYRKRHEQTGNSDDLEQAVVWARRLVERSPDHEKGDEMRVFLERHGDTARAGS